MRRSTGASGLALAAGLILWAGSAGAAAPPAFQQATYQEAASRAGSEGKLLVVCVVAGGIVACDRMEKDVWSDASLAAWMKSNTVALRLDARNDSDAVVPLSVTHVPTTIVLWNGTEVGRWVGLRDAASMLSWLREVDDQRRRWTQAAEAAPIEPEESAETHLSMARKYANDGQLERSALQYVWLWDRARHPAMRGVIPARLELADEMTALARRDDGVARQFHGLRASARESIDAGSATVDDLRDWIVLNRVVNEDYRTIAWVESEVGDPAMLGALRALWPQIGPLLELERDFREYGIIIPEPVGFVRNEIKVAESSKGPAVAIFGGKDPRVEIDNRVRRRVAFVHASLLSAGREEEAEKVMALALESLGSMPAASAIVKTALEARQARSYHLEALNREDVEHMMLRQRVQSAIATAIAEATEGEVE